MHRVLLTMCAAFFALYSGAALAGHADVVDVEVRKTGAGVFAFDVSVRHDDTGWAHYANKWVVLAPDGKVLGERVLLHPHENEQPFTRSLSGVQIPADVSTVTVRAYDKQHGAGGAEKSIAVPH